jgi:NADP-dependent 3-hydroxy acid dehydrogenase YdfG
MLAPGLERARRRWRIFHRFTKGDTNVSITDQFLVTGRTAIVTGASSGLGVTFARVLAEAGANVVLAARRVDRLEQVASDLKASGANVLVEECDVSSSAGVAAMVGAAWNRFGRVDILVNNAGVAAEAGVFPNGSRTISGSRPLA